MSLGYTKRPMPRRRRTYVERVCDEPAAPLLQREPDVQWHPGPSVRSPDRLHLPVK